MAGKPTYGIGDAIIGIILGQVTFTKVALEGVGVHGYGKKEILECIQDFILDDDFVKTIPSTKNPGVMLDVYRCTYKTVDWYVKLWMEGETLHVVSFKESGSELSSVSRRSKKNHRHSKYKVSESKVGSSKR